MKNTNGIGGWNRRWWNFWFPFFNKKNPHFGQFWKLPKFSRLDPDYYNIQLYDLLMVCPFNPGHSQYYNFINNVFILTYLYRIWIFIYMFGLVTSFKKALQGLFEKMEYQQKTLRGLTTPLLRRAWNYTKMLLRI